MKSNLISNVYHFSSEKTAQFLELDTYVGRLNQISYTSTIFPQLFYNFHYFSIDFPACLS